MKISDRQKAYIFGIFAFILMLYGINQQKIMFATIGFIFALVCSLFEVKAERKLRED